MTRTAILWLAALALAAATQLGASCYSSTPPPAPDTSLRLEVQNVYPAGSGYFLVLSLFVDSAQPFQAFDVSADWQGDSLTVRPLLDGEFDDDGTPFGAPLPIGIQTGPIGLRDVHHATPAPSGTVRVAEFWVNAPNGGATSLSVKGTLGRPDGSLATAAAGSLTYTP